MMKLFATIQEKHRALLLRLGLCLGILLAKFPVAAANLYSVLNTFNYSEGSSPNGGLTLCNGALFGTASAGGSGQGGEIFTVNPDGSGFTVIKFLANSNGIQPFGNLLACGGRLYGTATQGGTNGRGTVFSMDVSGSNFTVLQDFSGPDGQSPYASLIEDGGWLYGTTFNGGTNGFGTVFKVNTNGTGFTVLKAFPSLIEDANDDGARPYGGLVICGKTLYGTTTYGGTNGAGTVFKLGTNGCGFKVLKTFSAMDNYVNADGAYPYASLLYDDGKLYGTTRVGGTSGAGTVFQLQTDGSGFKMLKAFSSMGEDDVNSDGAYPSSSLILDGNTLYGTTYEGGTNGSGTLFKVNTIGAEFSALKHFGGDDGANPYAGVVMSGGTLFGTAAAGGSSGEGAVFSLALPAYASNPAPTLTIKAAGAVLTISWNTVPGTYYQVQYTSTLAEFNTWTNLRGAAQATGSSLSSFDLAQPNSTRCYRVVALP